jgi:hypothetical protein
VERTVLDEQTGSIEFEPTRPNLTGGAGPEPVNGRAALAHALRDVCFPVSKQELIRSVGNRTIEFRRGQPIRMKDALDRTSHSEFVSLLDAAGEIHRALDERKHERRHDDTSSPAGAG